VGGDDGIDCGCLRKPATGGSVEGIAEGADS
jgi:hypothetical protein